MADFRNMLGSDEDSNEDMDHIPKTPGPPIINSDHESDEEKSGDEKEVNVVKNNDNESDSDSDSSSSHSDSSEDNIIKSKNDSEVERSDNENEDNEEIEDIRETSPKPNEKIETNEEMSSDDNVEENVDKNIKESQNEDNDNDSDDEDIVRKVSPIKKRALEVNSDSSDDESDRNKRQRKESNEDEEDNEDNEDKDQEMVDKSAKAKDIFGELSSEEEDEDKQKDKTNDERDNSDKESVNEDRDNYRRDEESDGEDRVNRVGDSEQQFIEEEPPEEPIPETRIEVEIPRIVADLGREVHFVKLPNFLSIDTHPYDPQWYEDEIDEDENLDDEGRARLKLKVENTIRWRNVVDKETNELVKQSNTRVVKWSDGTYSLHLGEEIFDIHKHPLMTGDNNHLFIRQGTGLQGQTVFRTKLNFRPFSTESFTHRKLTLSLADRSQKTQKIRVLPNVGKDPEAHRTEMIKKEEDRLKASIRRDSKQRRVRERSSIRGPTASYLEPDGDEDEEEEGISIARIKNQYKRGSFNKSYDDPELSAEESKAANDDDDSEDDLFDKKSEKKKSTHIVESDDE